MSFAVLSQQLMAVFLNGPIGPLVALCVELDSNYVIETAPVLLRLMEENVAKARISQKGEHAQWDLVSYQVIMLLFYLSLLLW